MYKLCIRICIIVNVFYVKERLENLHWIKSRLKKCAFIIFFIYNIHRITTNKCFFCRHFWIPPLGRISFCVCFVLYVLFVEIDTRLTAITTWARFVNDIQPFVESDCLFHWSCFAIGCYATRRWWSNNDNRIYDTSGALGATDRLPRIALVSLTKPYELRNVGFISRRFVPEIRIRIHSNSNRNSVVVVQCCC